MWLEAANATTPSKWATRGYVMSRHKQAGSSTLYIQGMTGLICIYGVGVWVYRRAPYQIVSRESAGRDGQMRIYLPAPKCLPVSSSEVAQTPGPCICRAWKSSPNASRAEQKNRKGGKRLYTRPTSPGRSQRHARG